MASLVTNPCFGQSFRGLGGGQVKELSADGSTVVGQNGVIATPGARAWRWTPGGGLRFLTLPPGASGAVPEGVSHDGSFVVGRISSGSPVSAVDAVRWDAAGNLLSLGEGWAVAVSTDGKVIAGIGQSWTIGADGTVANEAQLDPRLDVFSANRDVSTTVGGALFPDTVGRDAFRWTRATGPVQLGHLPGHTYAEARDVSDDGRVVVGSSATHAPGGLYEAFRWTEDGGMVGLGDLPGGIDFSSATTVSADGSTVGGFGTGDSGPEYFLWTASSGMRRLSDVFRDAGVKFPGWQITAPFNQFSLGPLRMSGDGLTFAGTGINPQGQQEGWVAVIPEPAGLTLLLVATTSLLRRNQDPGRRSRKPKGTFRLSI